ncbi:DUF3108 domain-containing protein, partial [Deinococcus pimensis]|uniref:DUF3108 domain-containing protein n=1 Tax=Deinococcus pimensis TaxID=309888 RepID=UPI000480F03B
MNDAQRPPSAFAFTLSLAGRHAGEQTWQVAPDRSAWVARVQTDFGGVLPDLRRVQTSRLHPRLLTSLGYAEGDGRRASFETLVDRKGGTVTVRQGRDEATAPLVTDLHDPVSLLLWLRAQGDLASTEAHMVGGTVHVRRLPDADVDGVPARVFDLRPGTALVYVERDAPQRLLRL